MKHMLSYLVLLFVASALFVYLPVKAASTSNCHGILCARQSVGVLLQGNPAPTATASESHTSNDTQEAVLPAVQIAVTNTLAVSPTATYWIGFPFVTPYVTPTPGGPTLEPDFPYPAPVEVTPFDGYPYPAPIETTPTPGYPAP